MARVLLYSIQRVCGEKSTLVVVVGGCLPYNRVFFYTHGDDTRDSRQAVTFGGTSELERY